VLPQRKFDVPSMRAMDADVQVAIDELVFSTDAMAPMRGLRTHVRLNAGVLDLEALKANVAGGQVVGSTRLDTNVEPAKWGAQLHFGNVDIAGWLRGVRTPAGKRSPPPASNARALKQEREATLQATDQPPPSYVTGRLDAEFNVTGKGRSTAEILGSLDGRSHVTLHDATLSHLVTEAIGLDLAQALGVLIRGDRPLPLRCARFDFLLDNGVMKTQRGVVDNSDSTIRVAGTIDLRNETLGLVARVRPKDFSPLSLRTPVTVTGPIGAPVIGIQGRQLSGRVLGAVALAAVTPLAALLPLIDPGERDRPDPCAEAQASAPAASSASRGEPAVR
jgi:uncharacterized protein involved in outer membrane biogenesis